MSAHSDIGPSGADRWMNCAGSVALSRQAPEKRAGKYAAEGVVAHRLIEELTLLKIDELGLMARIGDVVEEDGYEITIDEEMVMHVLEYVREVNEEILSLGGTQINEWTEVKVTLKSIDPELWGTADKIVFSVGEFLIVRDFKYGQGKPVYPKENAQLTIYTLGALEEIGVDPSKFPRIEQVISQPRNGGTTRWVVPHDWLLAFRQRVKDAIEATRQPNAPLKAGDWCTFCRAKSICPEIEKVTSEETQVDFAAAPVPGALVRVETMEPWKVARILDHQDLIESWLSSVRQLGQQMLESGKHVPGYKLVDGRTSRKWKDGDGSTAAARYQTEHGDKVFAPRKVKSVAQMEVLVGKKNFDATLYETTPGHKKVANDNDPRPSTISTAQADFAEAPPVMAALPVDPLFVPNPSFFDAPAPRVVTPEIVEPPYVPRKIWPE